MEVKHQKKYFKETRHCRKIRYTGTSDGVSIEGEEVRDDSGARTGKTDRGKKVMQIQKLYFQTHILSVGLFIYLPTLSLGIP